MIFHENRLLAILMKLYHTLFFLKIRKNAADFFSSAAVVVAALSVQDTSNE